MDNEKNELMLDHVEKWRCSGLSIREYSESIGVSKGKFEYWTKKSRTVNTKIKYPEFVEIGSLKKGINYEQPQISSTPHPQIVLNFPSGLCLKIYG